MNNNNLVLREILDIVKNLSIKVDKIEDKVDKIEDKVDKIEDKVDKIENEIIIIKKDINSLKDYRIEVKSYQNVNAKEYEKEITKWLYNYLINNNYSVFFYIPSYEELPRDILNIDNESKKLKTITDLDGVIISTNINPLHKKNINTIHYTLYIIEAKHKLTISKIKKKIRQVIKFYKIINNKNLDSNLQKFKNSKIYLYFASPIIKKDTYDFIIDKKYLDINTWKYNKNSININDIECINNIYFISNNTGEYKILTNNNF